MRYGTAVQRKTTPHRSMNCWSKHAPVIRCASVDPYRSAGAVGECEVAVQPGFQTLHIIDHQVCLECMAGTRGRDRPECPLGALDLLHTLRAPEKEGEFVNRERLVDIGPEYSGGVLWQP